MTYRVAVLDPSAFTIPYDRHLCNGLVDADCEVTLFTRSVRKENQCNPTSTDSHGRELSSYNVCEFFYRLSERLPNAMTQPFLRKSIKTIEHIWNMAGLCKTLKRYRPNVIHFQWSVVPAIDGFFLNRLQQIAPCVLTVHDTNAFLAPSSVLQKIGWLPLLHKFDHLIVHTKKGKQALRAKGIDDNRISIVPHGVFDVTMGNNLQVKKKQSEFNPYVLLAFGTIKPYKGTDILIRALAALAPEVRQQIRLVIAGSPGDFGENLKALAGQLGVNDSIEWIFRFIPDEEVPSLFNRSDAVVFPYREIDASGALMTALPYGKPIVASRLGLFAELLNDGETAYLVESEDIMALAAAISKVVHKPKVAEKVGRRAAALAKDVLSWNSIARLTLTTYGEAAEFHKLTAGKDQRRALPKK